MELLSGRRQKFLWPISCRVQPNRDSTDSKGKRPYCNQSVCCTYCDIKGWVNCTVWEEIINCLKIINRHALIWMKNTFNQIYFNSILLIDHHVSFLLISLVFLTSNNLVVYPPDISSEYLDSNHSIRW